MHSAKVKISISVKEITNFFIRYKNVLALNLYAISRLFFFNTHLLVFVW
jgi:hypothetical protein